MKKIGILFLLGLTLVLTGAWEDSCQSESPSDKSQREQQEKLSQEGNAQIGMPGITNFTEKKIVRKLYELRDQNIVTFSYVMDLNGRLFHICDSIGYGLPYGVQFSNPEKVIVGSDGVYLGQEPNTITQSEPNGLFMPPTAEGTWIICASTTKKGDIEPVYVEPRVIVSPFKLSSVGEWQK